MDIQKRLQALEAMRQQATQEAVMQENMLQGARQRVAEIQGRINELQLMQKDKPVKQEETEGEDFTPTIEVKKKRKYKTKYTQEVIDKVVAKEFKPEKRKYKKRQKKKKDNFKTLGRKKLFLQEIDDFIRGRWSINSDKELRELIGNRFKVWLSIDQIKAHRQAKGWVADKPGRKLKKDSVDEMADDLDGD